MKKLSIVIPVYFNAESLGDLFEKLCGVEQVLASKQVVLQLIFVDDGSNDGSFTLLQEFAGRRTSTRVVKLTRNFGAISAVKTGLKFVEGDAFMFLAADLQDPPELITKMVDAWLSGSKYVVCERIGRDDPLGTKLFAYVYYKALRKFVVKDYPANGFDLALMDAVFLPHLLNSGKHINIPLFPYWLGFKPTVLQYTRQARKHGKSRWTFSKKLKLFIDSIFGFSFGPIRYISLIGLLVSLASFTYGAIVVVSAALGKVAVPGFATIIALISFLLGLIIVMLGIIAEYIWRIFDEVNRHPESVVDEVI